MLILVITVVALARTTLAACPCVEGGNWKYNGGNYFYCENPNGARTAWCPTQLNSDGTYTSNLPFSYCEGAAVEECKTLFDNNLPTCPCIEGGDWKYKGEPQSYCEDPSNLGYNWCATEVNGKGNFKKFAICSDAVKKSCDIQAANKPPAPCPCISGGQWTFEGERQSYCKKPRGLGKDPWCPTEDNNITIATVGSIKFKYCNTKAQLEACKELEGTKIPTICPCVEGGQWSRRGKQYSYCEEKPWCATQLDSAGNHIPGTGAECRGKTYVACNALHQLTQAGGKEGLYGEYTQSSTGCACWFDLKNTTCACCKEGATQCGAPLQNYCTSSTEGRKSGCLGIPANHFTLSTTGYPCSWDLSRTDCGWCAPGGAQCGAGEKQGHCWNPDDPSYCEPSTPGDCRSIQKCDSQATCKFEMKIGKYREYHSCICNDGWTGNGIECFDSNGVASEETESSSNMVSLKLAVSSKYYVYPHNSSKFPAAPGETDLINNITALFEAGATCAETAGCNGTFVNIESATTGN